MAASHSTVVIGHGDQVVNCRTVVSVYHKLLHVQPSESTDDSKTHTTTKHLRFHGGISPDIAERIIINVEDRPGRILDVSVEFVPPVAVVREALQVYHKDFG